MLPSHTFPSTAWSTAPTQEVYQRPDVPLASPQSRSNPQKQRNTVMQQKSFETTIDLAATYSRPGFAPSRKDIYPPKSPTYDNKLGYRYGIGLQLEKQRWELTYATCSGDSTARVQDRVNGNEIEPWALAPTSLDQGTLSSLPASNREAFSDFIGLTDLTHSGFYSDSYAGLGMTIDEENALPQLFRNGHGRSISQVEIPLFPQTFAPWSDSSEHARSSSASTGSYYLPSTQCCSPSDDCCDEFTIHDLDYPIEGTSHVLSDKMFDSIATSFDSFQLQSTDGSKHQYSFDNLFPSISHEPPLPNNAMAQTLPSTEHFDFFYRHGSTEGKYETKLDDSAEAPNLFRQLQEEQLTPAPEDMEPKDIDLAPGEQKLRFEGDMYTPKYVRGHGHKREGWCGICKPGRWLVLKNSAFWYDKSFTHGISAASGMAFKGPKETRRMSGNPDVWEGLCGSCDGWIALISSKKKGTTWFRHAYKCHTHQKSKEAPKRRRESNQHRIFKLSQTKRAKRSGSSVGEDFPGSLSSTTLDELDNMLDVSGGSRNISTLQTISGVV